MAKIKALKRATVTYSPDTDPYYPVWERVAVKGLSPEGKIRQEVLRSWQRCREIGLDPFSQNPPPSISEKRLRTMLRRNRTLTEVSKPVMDMIEISVKGTGFVITLAERNGYVLHVLGDRDVLEMAERNAYRAGCIRTIDAVGTNAIGLCIQEGKPIQLTGAEHFRVQHHPWTCSSAPIYDSNKTLMGVITLSGRLVGQHRHTLALVMEAAETIESQLREKELIEEKQQLNAMLTSIFNSISDGVISVDNQFNITSMNCSAARMLDLDLKSVEGKRLNEVAQHGKALFKALRNRDYFTGRETTFACRTGPQSYICSINPTRNASGHILGAIITMTEKRQVINIAKRIGGNYAKYEFKDIKGKNPGLKRQLELAKVAAKTNSRVLIVGESGTGKELFAQAIHCYSARKNEPFVAISCATIPRDLIESELFGYKEGAFTGARRGGMVGKFELANRGTLFLDEINGLPLELQGKLLRVLQQNEIMRLGDTRTIPVDVRVIAASNKDPLIDVEKGNFREDLYYRLDVVEIVIPPLRERIDDLGLLIDHIMNRQCNEMGIKKPRLSEEVMEALTRYHWPGNIRELENCIERALLLSQGKTIREVNLPERPLKKKDKFGNGIMPLRAGFKAMVESTLTQCGGNISMAARELKIARSTLYRKMKEFNIS